MEIRWFLEISPFTNPNFSMKKVTYLFLSAILMMLFACTQEDVQVNQPDDELSKAGKSHSPVFKVYPTGVDDTENIVQAFEDAKAAGPGAVVRLMEGTYTTNSIEVHDFQGYFIGAGKGKTTIKSSEYLKCAENWDKNILSFVFEFVGGDLTMSDMTLQIPDGFACESETGYGGNDLVSIISLADYTETYRPANQFIKAKLSNIDFIGGFDDGTGAAGEYNTGVGLWAGGIFWWVTEGHEYPLARMDVAIKDCSFTNFWGAIEGAMMGNEGKFVYERNYVNNCPIGTFLGFNYGANISVLNNYFKSGTFRDIWIDDNDWMAIPYVALTRRTNVQVFGNVFESAPGATSVAVIDSRVAFYPDNYLPQFVTIKNNIFKLMTGNTGVDCQNSQDTQVKNNRFLGPGGVGVRVDGVPVYDWSGTEYPPTPYALNALIIGNNFSGFNSAEPYIILGERSKNCTVIGGNLRDNVIDEGENNRIVNASLRKGPYKMQDHHSFKHTMVVRKP